MTAIVVKAKHATAPLRPAPRLDTVWVKFLLVSGLANDEVQQRLRGDDLPAASDAELDEMREAVAPPPNFSPFSEEHIASQQFVYRHHLEAFFRHDTTLADEVIRLLHAPRPRELVEAGFIVGVELAALAYVLQHRLGFSTSVEVLSAYKTTFFDTNGLSRSQLAAAVESRVRQAVDRLVPMEDAAAVRRAVAADGRVVATALPGSKLGWSAVLMAFGWSPLRHDVRDVLDAIETAALVRGHQMVARGGRDDDRRAAAFIGIVRETRFVKETIASPNDNLIAKLQQLRVKYEDRPLPSFDDLRARGDEISMQELGPAQDEGPESAGRASSPDRDDEKT